MRKSKRFKDLQKLINRIRDDMDDPYPIGFSAQGYITPRTSRANQKLGYDVPSIDGEVNWNC